MKRSCLAVLALAWCCVGGSSACILRPEKWPEDLVAGDLTGTAVGTPPRTVGQRPLAGARVRLKGTSVVRSTRGDGRFDLRNLPYGNHTLLLDWQERGAASPQLSARVGLEVRVSSSSARASRNLGRVELGGMGSIRGRVTAPVPEDVRLATVALTEDSALVHPAADGTFQLDGLAPGPWRVVAVLGALMSAPQDVTVEEGRTRDLDGVLDLQPVLGTGTLQGEVQGQPAPDGTEPDTVNATLTVVALAGGPAPALDTVTGAFGRTLNAGLYAVAFSAPNRLPVLVPNVLVVAGQVTNLGKVWMMGMPSGCVDLDGDGACFSSQWDAACSAQCRAEGPGSTCTTVTPAIDCDDDADGELDVDELQGPLTAGPGQQYGPCACGTLPGTNDGAACEKNPARADRDFDGVCDAYDAWPLCALNSPACDGAPSTDGGVQDGGALDAGLPDASTADAGPDAGSGVEHSVVNPNAPTFLDENAPTVVALLPSGDRVLAGMLGPNLPLMLGGNCTNTQVASLAAFVLVTSAAGACVQSWVFPGAVLLGADASTDGAVFVALGTQGGLSVQVGGAVPLTNIRGGPAHVHLLRLDVAVPGTWRATGVAGGWSSDAPWANGLRATPGGGLVAWGRSDGVTPLVPDTAAFTASNTTAWVEHLEPAFTVDHLEVWTGTDVNPSPQAVNVHPNGTILLAARAQMPVAIRFSPGASPQMVLLDATQSALVRSWTPTAQATQVLPFNGAQPPGAEDAIVAVAPTPNGARLAARQVNRLPSGFRPPAPFVYGPGQVLDVPGWQAIVEAEYSNGVAISARVVALDPRSAAGGPSQDAVKVLLDESGNTFVLGKVVQGASVWIPGVGLTELRRSGQQALAGYLMRINAAGQAAMVTAEAGVDARVVQLSMVKGPSDSVLVHGGLLGPVSFGEPPTCSTAAVPAISRHPVDLDPFVWTVPREAFDHPCDAVPFTFAPDPEPGTLASAGLLPDATVDLQQGDVDCFTFSPGLPGRYTLTVTTPQCVAPLTRSVFLTDQASGAYLDTEWTGTSACTPLDVTVPNTSALGVCVEGALGDAVQGVSLFMLRAPPPVNDNCQDAASILDVSTVFTGGLPYLLLDKTTVNASADTQLPLPCSWNAPAVDVFHRLQGGTTAGLWAAVRQLDMQSMHVPQMATLPDNTCPAAAPSCFPRPHAFASVTPNATLVVHGAPGDPADQFDYQLLILNGDPMAPLHAVADNCAVVGQDMPVDLTLEPRGVARLDVGMLANDVAPRDLSSPLATCGNDTVPPGADAFLRLLQVPAGGTVTLVAALENPSDGVLALSLLDACATSGPHCLMQQPSQGTFDSLTWTNGDVVPVDVVILVETSMVVSASATFARLAWELH